MTVNPVFASAFVPLPPIDIPRVVLPVSSAVQSAIDPFTSGPQISNRPFFSPILPDEPTRIDMARLSSQFEFARRERRSGNFESAVSTYRQILDVMESPFDCASDSSPLYHHMQMGGSLFAETVFELAALSPPQDAAQNLSRLTRFISSPPPDANTDLHLAKAWLLKAYTLMKHADTADDPQNALYEKAIRHIDYAVARVKKLDGDADAEDFQFYARLLKLEILAKQLILCHQRRDMKTRRNFIDRIRDEFNNYDPAELDETKLSVLSDYQASVAILKARLGLWGAALERARTVTSGRFGSTPAAKKLLEHELFRPFVDGQRVLSPTEIKLRSRANGWMKRLQAALAMAHSEGIRYSAAAGALGMAAGIVADSMVNGGHAVVSGAVGAALVSVMYRLKNGWQTDEALYAGEVGTFDRSTAESARDLTSLIIHGGFEAMAWTVPAAVMDHGTNGLAVFGDTLERAGQMYFHFGHWLMEGISSLSRPETYSSLPTALSHQNFGTILYNSYTKLAGLLFATNLLFPSLRSRTDGVSWLFLPGAVMLSADIGMAISGQSPIDFIPHFSNPKYMDRIERILIVEAEILLMMMVTGIVTFGDRSSAAATIRSVFKSFHPARTNYMLPLAAAITNGISSPLGGMMQKGTQPDDLVLLALQGAAITVGLLPITLGVSGVLKGKIPVLDGIREGWNDSRGANLLNRLKSAFAGGADAFNMPYARNRIGRAGTMDIIPAGLRAAFGWDTNLGQTSMSATNFVAGNGAASSTWPEPSGTRWERDSLSKAAKEVADKIASIEEREKSGELGKDEALALRHEAVSQLGDFFLKAGHVMHILQPALGHNRLSDRLWALHSVTRPFAPPTFPHMPNRYLFGNIHQMLNGGYPEKLDAKHVAALLEYIRIEAQNPDSYHTLRPLVSTFVLARNSTEFGAQISAFFRENDWILDVMDIDMENLIPPAEIPRRVARRMIRRKIRMPFDEYERVVASHGKRPLRAALLDGIFTAQTK